MHVPDGILDAPTSVGTAVVATVGVGLALRERAAGLDDRTAPLAGLVALFVFASQMLKFPVAAGTSGHLLGGALAAVLIGPWTGTWPSRWSCSCSRWRSPTEVSPPWDNVTLLGIVGVWVGWLAVGVRAVLPKRPASVVPRRRPAHWSRCLRPPWSSRLSSPSVVRCRCRSRAWPSPWWVCTP